MVESSCHPVYGWPRIRSYYALRLAGLAIVGSELNYRFTFAMITVRMGLFSFDVSCFTDYLASRRDALNPTNNKRQFVCCPCEESVSGPFIRLRFSLNPKAIGTRRRIGIYRCHIIWLLPDWGLTVGTKTRGCPLAVFGRFRAAALRLKAV